MDDLNDKLTELLHRYMTVDVDDGQVQVRTLSARENFYIPTRRSITGTLLIEEFGHDNDDSLPALHAWYESREKVNAGRYRGVLPLSWDVSYHPMRMTRVVGIQFGIDHIGPPSTMSNMFEWERERVLKPKPKPIDSSKHKPKKKKDYFDGDLFKV